MESLHTLTKKEFVDHCIKKIQEWRMLALSSIFSPFYNTDWYLPIVSQQNIASITELVDNENKEKAKDAFVDICVARYGLSGKMHRWNCLTAIQNIHKNTLLQNPQESEELKARIIEQLFAKYASHYEAALKQDFPERAKKFHNETWKYEQWILHSFSQSEEQWLKHKSIRDLQRLLIDNKSIDNKIYSDKDIVTTLLCHYLTQEKTGINWMNDDTYYLNDTGTFSWKNLITQYETTLDTIIDKIKIFDGEKKIQNPTKIRTFVQSFPLEQWEWSQDALDLLYRIYKNALKYDKFMICRSILSSIDLTKHFPDLKDSLDMVSKEITDKWSFMNKIKKSIATWDIHAAFWYAKTLGQIYIDTVYKIAIGAVSNDANGLRTLDYLIDNADKVSNEALVQPIYERRVTILLTFGEDVYNPEQASLYIKKYNIWDDQLNSILVNWFNGLVWDDLLSQNESRYIAYLDRFPLPSAKIDAYKFLVLLSIHKPNLNRKTYLSSTAQDRAILEEMKGKIQTVYNKDIPLHTITEEQSFILWEILNLPESKQKGKLNSIFNTLLEENKESVALQLIHKIWEKYNVKYRHRLPLVMKAALVNPINKIVKDYDDIKKVMESIAQVLQSIEWKESIYFSCVDKVVSDIINASIAEEKNNQEPYDKHLEMLWFIVEDMNTDIYGDKKEQMKKVCINKILDSRVIPLTTYIIDNFIEYIEDKSWRISVLFDKSIDTENYDLAEQLLSDHESYIDSDMTLQQIKIKRVHKSMKVAQTKWLGQEDFDNIFNLIQSVGKDDKITKELITLLTHYTVINQEWYDFLHTIYALETHQELHIAIQKKILDSCFTQFNQPPKKRIFELDVESYFGLLKELCEQQSIEEQFVRQLPIVIDNLYRLYCKKYRWYESWPEDYYRAYMFCNQIHDAREIWQKNAIHIDRNDWYKKKNNARVNYVAAESEIIDKSIQLLRWIGWLHKDTTKTRTGIQLEESIKALYDFANKEGASKITQQKIIEMLKEYYALTWQTDKLQIIIQEHLSKEDKQQSLRQELINFLHDKDNISLQQLEDLIAFLGIDSAADILFSQYPQFQLLGSMEVKSLIAEHLWDVLLQRTWLSFVDIPPGLDIRPKKFQDNMLTVIEKDFLKYYRETKRQSHMKDEEICSSYIQSLREKFNTMTSHVDVLTTVADKFAWFLDQILHIQIPDRLVQSLDSDREFPDFLQKLNAIEILNKKRFLIADGMGMGKSLSAILAKEVAWFKKCLLIVPSNTMDTRTDYLSDKVDAKWLPVGYFVKGKAPKVLVIDSLEELDRVAWGDNNYEYIIMSQERLSSEKSLDKILLEKFDYVVVDEIHKLKNLSNWKRASGLLDIVENIEHTDGYLCLLSGTPIPNTIMDIAILIKLLYPEEYWSRDNQELVSSIIHGDIVSLRSLLLPRMQMKELTENINMPELHQETKYIELGERERFYYDSIRNDENLTLLEKLMLLRKLCISPKLLWIQDIEISSKAAIVWEDMNKLFKTKRKVVLFFNAFIKGVLRSTENIDDRQTFIRQMGLDEDVQIRIIDGTTEKSDRKKIQDEFAQSNEKIALFVSGQTADVWIDLTAAEEVVTVVEPRTKSEDDQQIARVFRYRQKKNIHAQKYIIKDSIEKIISDYVSLKHKAIMKLYHGLKLTDLEKMVLDDGDASASTKTNKKDLNRGLIRYFKKSSEELREFYGDTKGVWSEKVEEIIKNDGENIAWYYKGLSSRSYQANVNRWHVTIINGLVSTNDTTQPVIVDLWSWPKMLHQHIDEKLQNNVISLDLNKHNFNDDDILQWKAIVGNFVDLPFQDNSVDILSFSLAFHDTSRKPAEKDYERLKVLYELQRVLKVWWSAIISLPYSMTYKDKDKFYTILNELWFEIQDGYSGHVVGEWFRVETVTLEKKQTINKTLEECIDFYAFKDLLSWLAFTKNPEKLASSKNVLTSVQLAENTIPIELNKSSQYIVQTEQNYTNLVQEWIKKYGAITSIPQELLHSYGFWRYQTVKHAVLLAQLPNNAWLFTYRKTRNTDT